MKSVTYLTVITPLALLGIVAVIVLWRELKRAPDAWEDSDGFHQGKPPSSTVERLPPTVRSKVA